MLRILNIPSPTTVANGGTGLASYAVGDLIYASGATTLAKLADVATGSVLVSGGVGAAPAWSTTMTAGVATAATWSANSAFAFFGYSTQNTTTGYALLQQSDGTTILNAASGKNLDLRIGNTTSLSISSASGLLAGAQVALANIDTTIYRLAANSAYLRGDSATGVGPTFQLQGKSSTTSGRAMWDEVMTWTDSTDASRKAKFVGSVYDTAAREAVRYEADGTQALISFGGGAQFKKLLSATATLDFGATAVANGSDLTITVTGAAVGDTVQLGTPASHDNNSDFDQWVSAADTVTVRFNNYSNASINPASGTFRATVFKF